MGMNRTQVSMDDVAKYAGVSMTTVSRVLNEDPTVRPLYRRTVLQAIKELGYVPNEAARGLRRARTRTIGYAAADLANTQFMRIVSGMEEVVRERGYSLLLCDSALDREVEAINLRRLYERRVEGLVVTTVSDSCPELALFAKAGIPVLASNYVPLVDAPPEIMQHSGEHSGDLLAGPSAALEHLVRLGHRRIALITLGRQLYVQRVPEYESALAELSLPYDPSLVAICGSGPEAVSATAALLARPDRPTAFFSGNYSLTAYVCGGIRAAGLAIPRDVSLITMGDSPWTEFHNPPLTTVFFDLTRSGRLSAEYLFARIDGRDVEQALAEYRAAGAMQLIVRESCAPPPG